MHYTSTTTPLDSRRLMEPVRDVPVFEQPSFLLRLEHPEPRHIRISVHSIRRSAMDTSEIDFGLADLFVEVDLTFHAE